MLLLGVAVYANLTDVEWSPTFNSLFLIILAILGIIQTWRQGQTHKLSKQVVTNVAEINAGQTDTAQAAAAAAKAAQAAVEAVSIMHQGKAA